MTSQGRPVLEDAEAERRWLMLAGLRSSLAALGITCTLVRNHRLVLRYAAGQAGPNGLTDPELYVFAALGTVVVTTDQERYQLDSGAEFPVADPAAAAAMICRAPEPATRT